jgi:hypothetical protein
MGIGKNLQASISQILILRPNKRASSLSDASFGTPDYALVRLLKTSIYDVSLNY